MPSSLFNQSGLAQMNDAFGMIRRFAEFKQQMTGQDPRAIVQGLLSSGKMSKQQFDQLSATARELQSILK